MKAILKNGARSIGLILLGVAIFQNAHAQAVADGLYDNSVYSPIVTLINSAQSSVHIEIYTMKDRNVRNAIRAALSRHIEVQVVQEPTPVQDPCTPFNYSGSDADCRDLVSLINEVKNAGGTYVPYNKSLCGKDTSTCVQHGKMTIIDRRTAMLSTGNYDYTNLCDYLGMAAGKCDRDYSYVISDMNLVTNLEFIFENDIKGIRSDYSTFAMSSGQQLMVSPFSLDPTVAFIDAAKSELIVENQYLKNSEMNAAIVRAAKRGVDVLVLVSSACAYGKIEPGAGPEYTQVYTAFDAAGVHSRMFTKKNLVGGNPGYMHAKTMVRDGEVAFVGSQNGSDQALTRNREFGVIFTEPTQVAQLRADIIADITNPGVESWQDSLACAEFH